MVTEACLAWDAIPPEANHIPHVDVVYVEESIRFGQQVLAIVVAAGWGWGKSGGPIRGAWRIKFPEVSAYRKRPLWPGATPPLTCPASREALWEIFPSNYLEESAAPNGIFLPHPESVHHYVIYAGSDDLYEVVAGDDWACEPMPDVWAHPFEDHVPNPK